MLVNYLRELNGQIEPEQLGEVYMLPAIEETKLPSVPYDQAIQKGPKGPDNFARFWAGLFDAKDKLKELKKQEKDARKSKDDETQAKC